MLRAPPAPPPKSATTKPDIHQALLIADLISECH
jgi:hypothetical protein